MHRSRRAPLPEPTMTGTTIMRRGGGVMKRTVHRPRKAALPAGASRPGRKAARLQLVLQDELRLKPHEARKLGMELIAAHPDLNPAETDPRELAKLVVGAHPEMKPSPARKRRRPKRRTSGATRERKEETESKRQASREMGRKEEEGGGAVEEAIMSTPTRHKVTKGTGDLWMDMADVEQKLAMAELALSSVEGKSKQRKQFELLESQKAERRALRRAREEAEKRETKEIMSKIAKEKELERREQEERRARVAALQREAKYELEKARKAKERERERKIQEGLALKAKELEKREREAKSVAAYRTAIRREMDQARAENERALAEKKRLAQKAREEDERLTREAMKAMEERDRERDRKMAEQDAAMKKKLDAMGSVFKARDDAARLEAERADREAEERYQREQERERLKKKKQAQELADLKRTLDAQVAEKRRRKLLEKAREAQPWGSFMHEEPTDDERILAREARRAEQRAYRDSLSKQIAEKKMIKSRPSGSRQEVLLNARVLEAKRSRLEATVDEIASTVPWAARSPGLRSVGLADEIRTRADIIAKESPPRRSHGAGAISRASRRSDRVMARSGK